MPVVDWGCWTDPLELAWGILRFSNTRLNCINRLQISDLAMAYTDEKEWKEKFKHLLIFVLFIIEIIIEGINRKIKILFGISFEIK